MFSVIKCVNGNFTIHAEGFTDYEVTGYHKVIEKVVAEE